VTVSRSDTQTLGDAGAVALEEDVGALHQPEDRLPARRVLEVRGHPPTSTEQRIGHLRITDLQPTGGAVDTDDLSAQVGEHHGRMRAWTQPGELYDAETG
jgi:hypothetical protein